jgi:hypothetical protein
MKKRLLLCSAITLALVASAGASVTFDFEGATLAGSPGAGGTADQYISSYMTGVYGSSVTATGGAAWTNDSAGADWAGKTGTDQWLRTYGAVGYSETPGYMQISFDDRPLASGSFAAYVFEATEGADLTISLYGSGYGDRYAPDATALIATGSTDAGVGEIFVSFSGLPQAVSLMVISNEGYHDVAIDDFTAQAVPAPGAILLGSLGTGLVGYLRRRKTL